MALGQSRELSPLWDFQSAALEHHRAELKGEELAWVDGAPSHRSLSLEKYQLGALASCVQHSLPRFPTKPVV